jgi:hypothetical protein
MGINNFPEVSFTSMHLYESKKQSWGIRSLLDGLIGK